MAPKGSVSGDRSAPPEDPAAVLAEVEAALADVAVLSAEAPLLDEELLEASDEQRPFSSWIDGEWTGPQYDAVPLLEPASREPYAHMVYARAPELHLAAESAARNSALWRGMPFAERARRLGRIADLVLDDVDALSTMIAREQGKPRIEALTHEILPALDHLAFTVRHAERYHAGVALDDSHPLYAHKHAQYLYDPIGVVALVTPDPLPFAIPLIQVVAALAMGNTVVLKPSERAPLCGLRVGELCSQAGIPPGVVNVVPALPDETAHIVTHAKVDKVFVTGTVEAGQHLMAAAGCMPRPVVLMLSGKHPSVVAGDADLARAARGIVWGALANCGQNCGAVERVYVEQSIASLFIERVLHEVDKVRVGSPLSDDVGRSKAGDGCCAAACCPQHRVTSTRRRCCSTHRPRHG
jgi:succinate-semialdehyde dehydrogenase/glutarate-semialdehyde dehydrogenase